jgi:Secretion system C-terminal sorting domain
MTRQVFTLLLASLTVLGGYHSRAKGIDNKCYFIENKGQIKDQNGQPRTDVQFVLNTPGATVFIGNGALHYQFAKSGAHNTKRLSDPEQQLEHYQVTTYRMDVSLSDADRSVQPQCSTPEPYYENYYLPGCPREGLHAAAFSGLVYKNVYPGIDWVLKVKNNKLEYEFVVAPGADASRIKISYRGQTALQLNADGSMTAATPLGIIHEHTPLCYTAAADGSHTILRSAYKLTGNTMQYAVKAQRGMVIDPEVEWSTYYGPDSSNTEFYALCTDDSAHIYGCGLTYGGGWAGNIATAGSYQDTLDGITSTDAYIVKFDTAGNRIWATFYGGSGNDWGIGIANDNAGNVYLGGVTNSTDVIATSGCQQGTYGGGLWDCFVARFTAGGFRVWSTYAGGRGANIGGNLACDAYGHEYIAGVTNDPNNIGTSGGFQPSSGGSYDCFLMQYDSLGALQWGTYYGGPGSEFGGVVCASGPYIYLTGQTQSTTGIATTITHQPALAGNADAFIAKFNLSCNRIWGTYYGGSNVETTGGIVCDAAGNIYLTGSTESDTGIATSGTYQTTYGGGTSDAFVAKFDPELGMLLWGSYFGGPGDETMTYTRPITDNYGNIYTGGITTSTSGISSPDTWQATYGGGVQDAFIAKFHATGNLLWSTYFGGSQSDEIQAFAFDGLNMYTSGITSSPDGIATTGSFNDTGSTGATYFKGFLTKFLDISSLNVPKAPNSSQTLTIYPVPNNGSFMLTGKLDANNERASYSVYNVEGQKIASGSLSLQTGYINQQIDVMNAAPGNYFMEVSGGDFVKVLRFVVK